MTFSEWKAKTMLALLKLFENADDEKLRKDLNFLMSRLEYLKSRDLSRFLRELLEVANTHPNLKKQLLRLVPSEEEIDEWFQKED